MDLNLISTIANTEREDGEKNLAVIFQKLIASYENMLDNINKISRIMGNTKMLSINSSIEAARVGEAGRGFKVIADEIQKFSDQCKVTNASGLTTMKELYYQINEVVGVQTAEVASHVIDKIDRNLFERNCDVHAWTTFKTILEFAINPSEEKRSEVISLLAHIHKIYEVYHDILMAGKDGTILAAGVHKELIGENVAERTWYKECMKGKGEHVSDMYFSKNIGDYCVAYSCRITDKEGNAIGVLSTRFNWNYIYDIINSANISSKGEIYVINKEGVVIASRHKEDVLKLNLKAKYPVIEKVLSGTNYGYEIEKSKEGRIKSILGYTHTHGYNSYKGKEWSVVVRESFE